MKRFSVISLLLFYLVSFTEFREVLRLPILIEHYVEHKSQVAEMSFFEFLVMHYKTDVAHDDTDMSLPFKDCGHSFSASMVLLAAQKISLSDPLETPTSGFQFFYLQHEPKLIAADIFQPPKL